MVHDIKLMVESQYFPSVILYKKIDKILNVEFDVYENYQKLSFRNRCIIMGANGPVTLSIPLEEGRGQRKPTREVRTANRYSWQSQHWKTIVSCYNRSPWFEFYRDDLETLYRKPVNFLVDWNLDCWEWMAKKLGIDISTTLSEAYIREVDVTKCLDFRNKILPKSIMHDFPEQVIYAQVFEERTGFIPHCSILDLLFCEGKNARTVLERK